MIAGCGFKARETGRPARRSTVPWNLAFFLKSVKGIECFVGFAGITGND
jgi:hypothetical protein